MLLCSVTVRNVMILGESLVHISKVIYIVMHSVIYLKPLSVFKKYKSHNILSYKTYLIRNACSAVS